ncbi:ZIP family metal transporter [Algibacillus agarilyticus]|uniref:ZIP family metal transporter n=1 Tax=Algibacillus agarilyticus TaxID=2234133 RepID=UPI000DD0D1C1|nr:divalent cation transporter [Algibacillus agarilyticus]
MLLTVLTTTLVAGLTMPLGAMLAYGVLARGKLTQSNWLALEIKHGILAFGGGALLSAVALVLVPEGMHSTTPFWAALFFMLGGISFMALDIYLKKIDTPASQLCAMLADFIPESIALGAAFAVGSSHALLLAGLIALQNLPEGFSAYLELQKSKHKISHPIIMFTAMAFLGPLAGLSGFLWLSHYPEIMAAIMLFASGGILYSIFQDIAPQVKLEKHWFPPLGAVLGFMLGMIGAMLT